jgi:hypothetical protein
VLEPANLGLHLAPGQQTAPFDATAVSAATAICATPEGPADVPVSGADLAAKLLGGWLHCDNEGYAWRGMQLLPDGTFSVLEDDGAGGLRAVGGFSASGSWSLSGYDSQLQPSNGPGTLWYLDLYCGECAASGSPVIERDPKRLIGHRWGGMGKWAPLGL